MEDSIPLKPILLAVVLAVALGVLWPAPKEEVRPTELTTARSLSRANVRLIGFDCGNHRMVALAEYEDEMPECRTIRLLDDKEDFL